MKLRYNSLAFITVLLLSACGGGGSADVEEQVNINEVFGYVTPDGIEECSAEDIKRRVDYDMRDYYVYYDQVPQLNLNDYESAETLIRDLRVDPDVYSYVTDAVDLDALNTEGRRGGFGFWIRRAGDEVFRFREILVGSPAQRAGALRGDAILEIDGTTAEEMTSELYAVATDPDNSPVNMLIQTGDETPRSIDIDFEDFTWYTVDDAIRYTRQADQPGPVVGYLPVRSFLLPTKNEIDAQLTVLEEAGGFDELIVDLRYNPGGFISVARHLASIVGGAAVADKPFYLDRWNEKYTRNNAIDFFDVPVNALDLPRVVVLVTEYSASASELFINSLEPYIDVVVIGDVTEGKAFTSNTREYCGKAINAMRSVSTNALGVSVAGGIQPDCPVKDDWQTLATSPDDDPLLVGALDYILTSACPTTIAADAPSLVRKAAKQELSYRDHELVPPTH